MVMAPDWVNAPERVRVSSASRVPPLIETVEPSVPASSNFIDPPDTVTAPDKVLPDAIDTGVVWATERLVTVESASTSRPKLASDVLTLATVIEFSRSLLLACFNAKAFVLLSVPPPLIVSVFAPWLTSCS